MRAKANCQYSSSFVFISRDLVEFGNAQMVKGLVTPWALPLTTQDGNRE